MSAPSGFTHNERQIFFIEPLGKDISFPRWRTHLYYDHHSAETVFFDSELAYETFLAINQPKCYTDYMDYRKSFNDEFI